MEYSKPNILHSFKFFGFTALGLAFLFSAIFSLNNHAKSVLFYCGWGATISALGAVFLLAYNSLKQKSFPAIKVILADTFSAFVVGGATVLIYCSVGLSVYDAYKFATSPYFSETSSIIVVGVATLVIGVSLFWFRLKCRCVYGISEIAVGVIVGSQRFYLDALSPASHTPAPFIVLAILTAGVYLVVRGADNVHQGLTKDPKDPVAQKFLLWLSKFGRTTSVNISITLPSGKVINYRNFERHDPSVNKVDESD